MQHRTCFEAPGFTCKLDASTVDYGRIPRELKRRKNVKGAFRCLVSAWPLCPMQSMLLGRVGPRDVWVRKSACRELALEFPLNSQDHTSVQAQPRLEQSIDFRSGSTALLSACELGGLQLKHWVRSARCDDRTMLRKTASMHPTRPQPIR